MSTTLQTERTMTPEESERFERLIEMTEAEKPDIIRRAKLLMAAGDEPGFNGDLRRAIQCSHVALEKTAAAANMQVFALCDFLEGTAELTSSQIAAIVEILKLLLVCPIPATPVRRQPSGQDTSAVKRSVQYTNAELEERAARAIAEEDAHLEETLEQCQLAIAAGDEPGFAGDLRRAIHSAQIPLQKVVAAVKMDVRPLCEFLEGTAELTSGQIAAIVEFLKLQLVRPIPATPVAKSKTPT